MHTFLSLLVMCRITKWKYQGTKTPQAWSVSGQPQGNASGLGTCGSPNECNANKTISG